MTVNWQLLYRRPRSIGEWVLATLVGGSVGLLIVELFRYLS